MTRKESLLVGAATLGCVDPQPVAASSASTTPPGAAPVAFVVGPQSNVIDIAGPYEVFSDTTVSPDRSLPPNGADHFSGEPGVHPGYAPYIVSDAQGGHTPAKIEWIREMSRTADVDFAKTFPKVELVRGPRFVDDGTVKSAGGLTSGIALALHVVGLMQGGPRADLLARYLEYVPTERPA